MAVTTSFALKILDTYSQVAGSGGPIAQPQLALRYGGWVTAGETVVGDQDLTELRFYTYEGASVRLASAAVTDAAIADLGGNQQGLVGTTSNGHIRYLYATESGSTVVDLGVGQNADISRHNALGFAAVWEQHYQGTDSDIVLSLRRKDGTDFKTFSIDTTSATDRNASVASANDGTMIVAWERTDDSGAERVWYAIYDTQGVAKVGPTPLDENGSSNTKPKIAYDGRNFAIAYQHVENDAATLKVATLLPSGIKSATAAKMTGIDDSFDFSVVGGLFATIMSRGVFDGGELRDRDIHIALTDPVTGKVLTDPDHPVPLDVSMGFSTAPAILNLGTVSGAFIASYADEDAGEIRNQKTVFVEAITGDDRNNNLEGRTSGIVRIDGAGGNDHLRDSFGDDRLKGGTGNDVLDNDSGNDRLDGGTGVDTVALGDGDDVVVSLAVEGPQDLGDLGIDTLISIESLTGGEGADTLIGNDQANTLDGGYGDDGGVQRDVLVGGGGNDTYVVRDSIDIVSEADASGGTDLVRSYASYVLSGNVENLRLISGDIDGTGNRLKNVLTGSSGANRLDGGLGADTISGGKGSDVYYVDNAGDKVAERSGEGLDVVATMASYTLAAGQSIERLVIRGTVSGEALNLTGNDLGQEVRGNAAKNVLDGKAGKDTLQGFGSADAFAFSTTLALSNVDHIVDFSHSADQMQLAAAVFAQLPKKQLAEAAFKDLADAGAKADGSDRILYDHDTGNLWYDGNGSGSGGRVLFAVLDNSPTNLDHTDFIVV